MIEPILSIKVERVATASYLYRVSLADGPYAHYHGFGQTVTRAIGDLIQTLAIAGVVSIRLQDEKADNEQSWPLMASESDA